jgi:hypothetical protein
MPHSSFHLAQVNIARLRAPITDPVLADFVANLDRVNGLAEAAPGFVWRLKGDEGNALAVRAFDDEALIINISVWDSIESLFEYTYKSDHVEVFRRRAEWFVPLGAAHLALWWIPAEHQPDANEAKAALAHLDAHGPTPRAFTFRQRFTPEDMLAYTQGQPR